MKVYSCSEGWHFYKGLMIDQRA